MFGYVDAANLNPCIPEVERGPLPQLLDGRRLGEISPLEKIVPACDKASSIHRKNKLCEMMSRRCRRETCNASRAQYRGIRLQPAV